MCKIIEPLRDNAYNRRMALGHAIRTGHALVAVLVYDGNGIWHIERSCCDDEKNKETQR